MEPFDAAVTYLLLARSANTNKCCDKGAIICSTNVHLHRTYPLMWESILENIMGPLELQFANGLTKASHNICLKQTMAEMVQLASFIGMEGPSHCRREGWQSCSGGIFNSIFSYARKLLDKISGSSYFSLYLTGFTKTKVGGRIYSLRYGLSAVRN